MRLFLVTTSKRRIEILRRFGYEFEIIPPRGEERIRSFDNFSRDELIEASRQKLYGIERKGGVFLAADTVVVLDGKVLGKPRSVEEAWKFLKLLSGRVHKVYTAFVIRKSDESFTKEGIVETKVYFSKLNDKEIELILKYDKPLDKAGAYAIQGLSGIFVRKIEGCFFNVVGLPLPKIYPILNELGVRPKLQEDSCHLL